MLHSSQLILGACVLGLVSCSSAPAEHDHEHVHDRDMAPLVDMRRFEAPDQGASQDMPQDLAAGGADATIDGLKLGQADDFSSLGCELLQEPSSPRQELILVDDRALAGQVLMLPSSTQRYTLSLPEGKKGYLTLEVPEWKAEIAIYVEAQTSYKVLGADVDVLTPLEQNPSCVPAKLTHARYLFHSWGAFVVELDASGPREVNVVVVHTNPTEE